MSLGIFNLLTISGKINIANFSVNIGLLISQINLSRKAVRLSWSDIHLSKMVDIDLFPWYRVSIYARVVQLAIRRKFTHNFP
jgi:hypothetical protein